MASVKSTSGGEALAYKLRSMRERLSSGHLARIGFLEGASYPDGNLNVPTVAALQEYGAPEAGIPARPFFSGMIKRESPMWGERFGQVMKANDMDAVKSLEIMGMGIAGQLRQAIVDYTAVPNSPVTDLLKERFPMGGQTFEDVQQAREDVASGKVAAQKGKPLIHTGHMLNSVDSEVE
jgi:hypothetical protein